MQRSQQLWQINMARAHISRSSCPSWFGHDHATQTD
jgi:hypothetical protein